MESKGFVKRDVDLIRQSVKAAIDANDRLNKVSPQRELSIALTNLQTADLWLAWLESSTPERMG